MLAYAMSDIGKVREINEDSMICLPPLFLVADGMGGHVAGEIASRMATDTICKFFTARRDAADPESLLREAVQEANLLVYRLSQEKAEYAGMGTTVTAVIADGRKLYWGHVGDSRLYLLHGDDFCQITPDHSLVWELVKSGNISPEEALTHPHRNILTRAVGTDEAIKVDTGVTEWELGDKILLCTDGLTNMVRDEDIAGIINAADSGDNAVDELITQANAAGGLDNITAVLVYNEVE